MNPKPTVLVIDDEAGIRKSLSAILTDEGYRVAACPDGPSGLAAMESEPVQLVLLDIWMDGMDGVEVLGQVRERWPQIPVVMMSGHGTIETAVSTLKAGAYDYLEKPLSLERVTITVSHAIKESRLSQENNRLRDQIHGKWEMVGESPSIQRLKSEIERVAGSCARALITGENGSGKELVARALHTQSTRRDSPFIEINCAALPEHLIESELFGYEKGAFSGAESPKPGMFEMADQGTLFLDEVGDMTLATQARVLRVLQEGTFQRLGDTRKREVDVWVIAATNRDLKKEIAQGRFREDLFYRLNVVPLEVPPLRERREDIPALVAYFAENAVHEQGLPQKRWAPEVIEILQKAPWPGNVRELKNTVERLIIMSPGNQVGTDDLPDELAVARRDGGIRSDTKTLPLREARDAFEAEHIRRVLAACGGNISKAAERLKVERSNLSKKIRQLGIGPDDK
ncbi:MAG: sigma-54-dependent transcriptional regulator [Leptospirillia bacterium]